MNDLIAQKRNAAKWNAFDALLYGSSYALAAFVSFYLNIGYWKLIGVFPFGLAVFSLYILYMNVRIWMSDNEKD